MTQRTLALALGAALALGGCSKSSGNSVPGSTGDYVVVAWNDLGMHCLNPSYDTLVILPPYNTLWAQVVKRGERPQLVTQGVTVHYRIPGNTYSYATAPQAPKGKYGQFWDFAGVTFGVDLPRNVGLDLKGPERFGLEGDMVLRAAPDGGAPDHFEANGIPLTPVDDAGTWNPYQVAEITVRNANGDVLQQTRTTIPTSDEISCDRCHVAMGPTADAFTNILALHDQKQGTTLRTDAAAGRPALCGGCHATPALGVMAPSRGATTYVSGAIHGFHGALPPDQRPACYDCHPGPKTQCSRSTAHMQGVTDGNCTHCHGALAAVGATGKPADVPAPARVPWAQEPACVQCHAGVPEVDTAAALYRNARGHGQVYCAGCHGSPHAMVPSRIDADNAQAVQYQGKAVPLGDCNACHGSSHPGSTSDFWDEHGPGGEHASACNVCHTKVPSADSTLWPHGFGWKPRKI